MPSVKKAGAARSSNTMNTAQLVLTENARTVQRTALVPWIIGGIVVIVALYVISKIKA